MSRSEMNDHHLNGSSTASPLSNMNAISDALPTASGQANPQAHGWEARTPFNYEASKPEPGTSLEGDAPGNDDPVWAHNAAKYEWDDTFGDVGPRIPELEEALFKRDLITTLGSDLRALTEFTVTQEGPERVTHVREVCFGTSSVRSRMNNIFSVRARRPAPGKMAYSSISDSSN